MGRRKEDGGRGRGEERTPQTKIYLFSQIFLIIIKK